MENLELIDQWELNEGVDLMGSIGVKQGHTFVDFGCSVGHYVFPLSTSVGEQGRVYAVDRDVSVLRLIDRKSKLLSISNIHTVLNSSNDSIPIENESCDGILFYDILHSSSLDLDSIISESHRILKTNGIMSVLPFHMSNKEIKHFQDAVTNAGFALISIVEKGGLHFEMFHYLNPYNTRFEDIEKGDIYVFKKMSD